jgi:putative addiction module CopG family antidote
MVQLAIELDDQQQRQVDEAVASGRFDSAGAYIADLLKRDQGLERQRLIELIQAGIDSGPPIEMTPEQFADCVRQGAEQARREQAA